MSKNVSNQFKNVIKNGGPFYAYATFVLSDGTQLTLDSENDFYINGNNYSESGGDGFPLGAAVSKAVNISIDNYDERYSKYDFYYSRITLYTEADLADGTVERLKEGTFTVVDPVANGDIIEFTAYDDMYKADITYVSGVNLPSSALVVLQDVCGKCGINLGSAVFANSDFQITSIPENLTCRQVIGYIAMIAVGNAAFDVNNRLIIKSYDFSVFDTISLAAEQSGDSLRDFISSETFGNYTGLHVLTDFSADPEFSTDDVVITGVRITVEGEDEDEILVYGTEDYALTVENPLVEGNEEELITIIGQKLNGVIVRPFYGDFFPDPTIEFMDCVYVVDRKNNVYQSFITDNVFTYLGNSSLENGLESPTRNDSEYFSTATEIYRKARREIKRNKTEWEKTMEELTERVNNSSGLYMKPEVQPDGSKIYYMHDKPTLAESMIIWKMTAEAIAVSTDGGKTYNAGLTVDGTLIAKIMNTIGINFDWGIGGTLIIKDKNGKETAYMDAETGEVRLNVQSLSISGKTIEEIASDKLNDFVDAVFDPQINNLQAQIDGQIETWFYDYIPTASNYPASEWTTDTEKDKHLGDLFYVVDNTEHGGEAYRWAKISGTYTWDFVEDTAVAKALADAANAQDTADQKRRVFVSTPVPPYDIGDLWLGNTNSDLMRCQTARASGVYNSSDWTKAVKYTDDTVANEALEEATKAKSLIMQLDNEYQSITTDSSGNYDVFPECKTKVYVMWGSTDISLAVTYTVEKSDGITGSWSAATRTYTVTGLSTDEGWVDITAKYLMLTVTKRFNIAKQKQGIQGPQGLQGLQGEDGKDGIPGTNGIGVTGSVITYQASSNGTSVPTGTWQSSIPTVSAGQYLWTRTVIKYTDNTTSTSYSVGKMGTDGTDGKTSYFHIKYSSVANPTSSSQMTETPSTYIGTYVDFTQADSNDPTKYTWARFEGLQGKDGTDGIPGTNGEDGKTSYLHIKYSNDGGKTFTANSGETPGTYIGQYVDFTQADSTNVSSYSWAKIKGEAGANGVGVTSVDVQYYLSTSATALSGGSWSTTAPAWVDGKYIWSKTVTTLTDGTKKESTAVCITGGKGATGETGATGATGKGISSITEEYYLSTSKTTQTGGSWSTTPPTWSSGKYVWTRSKIVYTNPSSTAYTTPVCDSSWEAVNEIEIGGRNLILRSGNFDGWTKSSNVILMESEGYTTAKFAETTTLNWNAIYALEKHSRLLSEVMDKTLTISLEARSSGAYTAGRGLLVVFALRTGASSTRTLYANMSNSNTPGGTSYPPEISNDWQKFKATFTVKSTGLIRDGQTSITGWSGTGTIDDDTRYAIQFYNYALTDLEIRKVKLEIGNKATDWTPAPEDLYGISSVTNYYAVSSSNTTAPTSGWSTAVPALTATNKYLWSYEVVKKTDGSTETSDKRVIGVYGDTGATGKGIKSVTNYYLASASSSGVTTSTSGWTTTIQTISTSKKYLWNYEKITYTDNTTTTTVPCIIGAYGNTGATGNGISSIAEHYAVSASNTTAPTSWSSTPPTMTATNKYLWNYETITYTNGSTADTTKRVIGVYGNTGATGPTGAAGKGIKSITEYYLASGSSSGVTISTSGWTTTLQTTTTTKKYLWNYEKITYTDNTTSNTTVRIISTHGATGTAARTYFIEPSVNVLKRGRDNAVYPNTLGFSAYYRDGNSTTRTVYSGRFVIEKTTDGKTWTEIYRSSQNESSVTHTLTGISKDVVQIRAKLYAAGGTTTLMDIQSVAVVTDVDALTPLEVLELASQGMEGIYSPDGIHFYFSASAIKSGIMQGIEILSKSDNDWMRMYQSLLTGGYGSTTDGLLDLSANYADGRHVVLESKTGDVILKSKNEIKVERQSGTMGYLVQSGTPGLVEGDTIIIENDVQPVVLIGWDEDSDAMYLRLKNETSKYLYPQSSVGGYVLAGYQIITLDTGGQSISPNGTSATDSVTISANLRDASYSYTYQLIETGWLTPASVTWSGNPYYQLSCKFLNTGSYSHSGSAKFIVYAWKNR